MGYVKNEFPERSQKSGLLMARQRWALPSGHTVSETKIGSHTRNASLVMSRSTALKRSGRTPVGGEGTGLMVNSHGCNARPHRNGIAAFRTLGIHQVDRLAERVGWVAGLSL